jgi:hypothetical protein
MLLIAFKNQVRSASTEAQCLDFFTRSATPYRSGGITKKFNQQLHDQYDPPARKAVSDWVQMKWGANCIPNPNEFGVDLIVLREGKPVGYIEVEVRGWNYCHYSTIHVNHRKEKLFQQDLPVLFFALTQDLAHAYWCHAKVAKGYPLIEVKNFEVPTGEMFFDIPVEKFKYVNLTDQF